MPITLYDATVPVFRQLLGAAKRVVDKAEAHCTAHDLTPADLIEARLIADIGALSYQVRQIAHHSAGAIAAARAGKAAPEFGGAGDDFESLRQTLAVADAELAGLDAAEVESFIGRDVVFTGPGFEMAFRAEDFLLSFSVPNFFFHATTFYDILRHKGVAIGKRDYLGRPRLKA
ncbi:DUF1993 domain-containing protein [Sandarakinorhabdus sp. DWP1-3-1]|uniref:DUF1993 domain-containing protein n=1 Tax=Sandarakinorhabdus sp. DWP1-3-1 TaxID=2804627 RepID=UPI003CED04A2